MILWYCDTVSWLCLHVSQLLSKDNSVSSSNNETIKRPWCHLSCLCFRTQLPIKYWLLLSKCHGPAQRQKYLVAEPFIMIANQKSIKSFSHATDNPPVHHHKFFLYCERLHNLLTPPYCPLLYLLKISIPEHLEKSFGITCFHSSLSSSPCHSCLSHLLCLTLWKNRIAKARRKPIKSFYDLLTALLLLWTGKNQTICVFLLCPLDSQNW